MGAIEDAIAALAGKILKSTSRPAATVEKFDVSGTWTKPPGAVRVKVQAWGGGSGGGTGSSARGGAGGAYNEAEFNSSALPASVAVTVGAAGIGSTSTSSSTFYGSAGGDSTFGAYLTAKGGSGGSTPTGGSSYTSYRGDPEAGYGAMPLTQWFGGGSPGVSSVFGGGGGCGDTPDSIPGQSQYGGKGGRARRTNGGTATAGEVPGGGGGAGGFVSGANYGPAANGGQGRVTVTTYYF